MSGRGRRPDGDGAAGRAAGLARGLARLFLRLYPRGFREEMGGAFVEDVGRRAGEMARTRSATGLAAWFARLIGSLLGNAVAVRRERGRPAASPAPGSGSPGSGSPLSWLDVKLGMRLLARHPGMSVAAVLGIAVAVAIEVGFFAFADAMFYPRIPLPEGDRMVGVENWDVERNNEERRSLFDYGVWREELESVDDLTAFRTVRRNWVAGPEGPVELVPTAEITPSGFRLARVAPLLGRPLVEADARPGAPPVIVVGYDFWRANLAGDRDVVGSDFRLGNAVHTIVGVMPEGFGFPVSHQLWVPMKADLAAFEPGEGPEVFVSGRLAPGVTLEEAQTELTVIQERMAAAHPETHQRFRAQVMPYAYPILDVNQQGGQSFFWQLAAMLGMMSLLLVVVCVNVAVLVYARTAARRDEIAIRTALGASRMRVVAQLFSEALVLSTVGALLGLGLAKVGIGLGERILRTETGGGLPFFLQIDVSGRALAWAAALTLMAAFITGVLPGLQATSRRALARVGKHGQGPGLGRTWTLLIVGQVALAVAALPVAVVMGWWEVRGATTVPTFDTDRFVSFGMAFDTEPPTGQDPEAWRASIASRTEEVRRELVAALEAEPRVAAFAVSRDIPGLGGRARIVLEGDAAGGVLAGEGHGVRRVDATADYMETLGVPLVAGRSFTGADHAEGRAPVAVVDERFARRFGGARGVVGRRLRFVDGEEGGADDSPDAAEPERWHEIVGVVQDRHRNPLDEDLVDPTVYRAARWTAGEDPLLFTLRMAAGDGAGFSSRIRQLAVRVDPTLRVGVYPLTRAYEQGRLALGLTALALTLILAAVLALSAVGIYSLMSFTVTQRRREIGVRTALGAHPRRLLMSVFARSLRRLGTGVVLGVVAAVALDAARGGELLRGYGSVLLPALVAIMFAVGALAAAGPARRGLRIEPAEALRAE